MGHVSHLERVLTARVNAALSGRSRTFLRVSAFTLSVISCLFAASIVLFSMFAVQFQQQLHYNQIQINVIAVAAEVGMYLPLPVLGIVADLYGPVILAFASILLYCPGYLFAAFVVKSRLPYLYMVPTFAMIGTATSSLYLCAIIACTKTFPDYKGLSISLPVACYGLSSLLESQVVLWLFGASDGSGRIDLVDTFVFFAGVYFVTGVFNWLSSCVVVLERGILESGVGSVGGVGGVDTVSSEETRLIAGKHGNYGSEQTDGGSESATVGDSVGDSVGSVSGVSATAVYEGTPGGFQRYNSLPGSDRASATISSVISGDAESLGLVSVPSRQEVSAYDREFRHFLRDPSMWILMGSLFLVIGPLEMFLNNMGSIALLYNSKVDPSVLVSLHAGTSTVARFVVGVASDWLAGPNRVWRICRVWLILASLGFIAATQWLFVVSSGEMSVEMLYIITLVEGACYGTVFTIYPTVVAYVWGLQSFGSHWGAFMLAPAASSFLYGLTYAADYESHCVERVVAFGANTRGNCLVEVFVGSFMSFLSAFVFVYVAWKWFWVRRNPELKCF